MTDLNGFLKTGRLGPIVVGMSRDDVQSELGSPHDRSVNRYPQVWKYGALQLTFYKSPDGSKPFLASITINFYDRDEHLPAALSPTGWFTTSETTFQEFRSYLDANQVRVVGGVTSGPHKHLVLESAVRITFDDDRLYSIGFAMKREPDLKQLTVKVRRKDFALIESWARGRGISPSDLCSEWIKEQVSLLEKAVSP